MNYSQLTGTGVPQQSVFLCAERTVRRGKGGAGGIIAEGSPCPKRNTRNHNYNINEVRNLRFKCNSIEAQWEGVISNLTKQSNVYEFWIKSRSNIMVVFGPTSRGGFACFPDFQVGCHLADLKDKFWNTEQLIRILGEADGVTVVAALYELSGSINFS
jgi:hypothetical protein